MTDWHILTEEFDFYSTHGIARECKLFTEINALESIDDTQRNEMFHLRMSSSRNNFREETKDNFFPRHHSRPVDTRMHAMNWNVCLGHAEDERIESCRLHKQQRATMARPLNQPRVSLDEKQLYIIEIVKIKSERDKEEERGWFKPGSSLPFRATEEDDRSSGLLRRDLSIVFDSASRSKPTDI